MKEDIIILNFTNVYEKESFYKKSGSRWLDFTGLEGSSCYCSEEAEFCIKEKIEEIPLGEVHFLDSGNYHYLTKFWTDRIKNPFSLLLFDHHTDMQEPAFFGLLSCGSWVKAMRDENSMLNEICIVGPPAEDFLQVKDDRLTAVSKEELRQVGMDNYDYFLKSKKTPLYISVDKDVLREMDAATNWSQGQMKLEELEIMLEMAFDSRECVGVDVCGEPVRIDGIFDKGEIEKNSKANERILKLVNEKWKR